MGDLLRKETSMSKDYHDSNVPNRPLVSELSTLDYKQRSEGGGEAQSSRQKYT